MHCMNPSFTEGYCACIILSYLLWCNFQPFVVHRVGTDFLCEVLVYICIRRDIVLLASLPLGVFETLIVPASKAGVADWKILGNCEEARQQTQYA